MVEPEPENLPLLHVSQEDLPLDPWARPGAQLVQLAELVVLDLPAAHLLQVVVPAPE